MAIYTNPLGQIYTLDGRLITYGGANLPSDPPIEQPTNPAPFYFQSRGPGASQIILSGVDDVVSVSANAEAKFIQNLSIGGIPKVVVSSELGGATVLYFPGTSGLEMDTPVTPGFLGNNPRSIYLYAKTSGDANRNIFGYGDDQAQGEFDFLGYNGGATMSIHTYASNALAQVGIIRDKWEVIRARYINQVVYVSIDDRHNIDGTGELFTSSKKSFRLGLGGFQPFNYGGYVYIAHMEAYDRYLTDEEDLSTVERIRSIYS